MAGFIDGFERFWNSSFGLPQQALFRLLRVIQDPDVDFLDDEGFGDGALVPLLGMFDADRHDVKPEEQVSRVNQLTGLELDEDGFMAQLGVGIVTDPISFLSSGATTAAKAAQRLGRAADTPAVRALRKAGDAPQLTAGRLGEHIETALSSAATPAKQRKLLRQGQAALEGIEDKGALVSNLRKSATERELRFGLPILTDFGLASRPVQSAHDSWFKLLGSNIPGRSVVAHALNDYGSKVPILRAGLRSLSDVRAGLKHGAGAHSMLVGGEVSAKLDKDLAGPDMSDLFDKVTVGRAEKLAEAGDTPEELLKALFGRSKPDQNLVQRATGVDDLNDLTRQDLREFAARYEQNQVLLGEGAERALTEAGEAVTGTASYKFGAKLKALQTQWFKTDSGVEALADAQNTLDDLTAVHTEQLRELQRQGWDRLKADAAELGESPEHLEEVYNAYLQYSAHQDDLTALADLARNTPDQARRFGDNLVNSAIRMSSSARNFITLARGGKATPGLKQMADVLEKQLAPIQDGRRLLAKFDELGEVRIKGDLQAPEGLAVNQFFVGYADSELSGRWLGHVPDPALLKRQSKLTRKATTTRLAGDEVQARITDSAQLSELQSMWTRRGRNAQGELETFGMTPEDVLHNLDRARKSKTGIKTLQRAKGVGRADAPKSMKLTKEQADKWKAAAKANDSAAFRTTEVRLDILRPAEREELHRINELLEARRTGAAKLEKRTKSATEVIPSDPRTPVQVDEGFETAFGTAREALGDGAGRAIAQMLHAGTELRRASSTGVITPALVEYGIGAANRMSRQADEMLLSALGENGSSAFRFMREQQAKITMEAVKHGIMSVGSPIAYVGRILSSRDAEVLDDVLQNSVVQETLQNMLPQLSSSFARQADNLSIEELNDIHQALRAQNPAIANKLAEIAEANDIKLGKYETSPINSLITRLSQANERETSVRYFHDALDALSDSGTAIAGQITHRVMANGKRTKIGESLRARKVGDGKGLEAELELATSPIETEMTGVILRDHNGKERFIPKSVLGDHMVGIRLGKRDKAVVPGFETEAVDATANAFGVRAGKGALTEREVLSNPAMVDSLLDDLVDEHVIFGDEKTVKGMFGAMSAQFEHGNALTATIDTVNNTVKRWQTVMRPSFHIFNVGSAQFQTAALGVNAKNIALGNMDAMRFLTKDPAVAEVYNRAGLYSGSKGGRRLGWVARAVRSIGPKGDIPLSANAKAMEELGLTAEDMVFHAGGQSYDVGEILQAFADGGLYGTFISQGLRGSGKVSRMQEMVRRQALDTSKLGKAKAFVKEVGQDSQEATEIYARTMAVFAQLRQGVPLDQAVESAKQAMVNYSRVTKFEKNVMKRAFTYYTFPRHYLPFAYKHYSENPAAFSRAAHLMTSAEAESGSPLRENNGRIELNLPGDRVADLTRLNPNLEAVKLIEAAGEIMLGTADSAVKLAGGSGVEAFAQEELSGRTRQPFEFGSPVEFAGAVGGIGDDHPLQVASDAFWISRFAFDPGDPLRETSPVQKLMENVFTGVKKDRPKARMKALEYRYNRLIRDMERRAELTTDLDYRRELREEARRLTELAKEQASRID